MDDGMQMRAWIYVAVETPVDGEPRMGRRLRDRFAEAYWCMALEFGRGTFQTRRIRDDASRDRHAAAEGLAALAPGADRSRSISSSL